MPKTAFFVRSGRWISFQFQYVYILFSIFKHFTCHFNTLKSADPFRISSHYKHVEAKHLEKQQGSAQPVFLLAWINVHCLAQDEGHLVHSAGPLLISLQNFVTNTEKLGNCISVEKLFLRHSKRFFRSISNLSQQLYQILFNDREPSSVTASPSSVTASPFMTIWLQDHFADLNGHQVILLLTNFWIDHQSWFFPIVILHFSQSLKVPRE